MVRFLAKRFSLVALALASLLVTPIASADPPSVAITKITGMQPGWVRVTISYQFSSAPSFKLAPTCGGSTTPQSIVTSTALVLGSPQEAFLDLKVDLRYLADNGLPAPCQVTALQVQMLDGSTVLATTNLTISFPMDVPLSHLQPDPQISPANISLVTSLPLQLPAGKSRYAAYPPRLIGIVSDRVMAFAEVEELLDRGSVGLRGLSTFHCRTPLPKCKFGGFLTFELGGGSEIFPGWGLDVKKFGVIRDTTGTQESNPGIDLFPYNGIEPPILTGDKTLQILPAPPVFSDLTYLKDVLNNRQVPRCPSGSCLDVVYNQSTHTLDAVNGAQLFELDPGPIPNPPTSKKSARRRPILEDYELETVSNLAMALWSLKLNIPLPPTIQREIESPPPRFVDLRAKNLGSSVAQSTPAVQPTIAEHSRLVKARGLSPQESDIEAIKPPILKGPIGGNFIPRLACVMNTTSNGVIKPLSQCKGFSQVGFRCPTVSDPLRPEDLPSAPGKGTDLSLFNTIPPYYASRDNLMGTCGSHAANQYVETLLDRYSDDLAPKRLIYVDGLPVTVPAPRVATSVSSGLWELYSWAGTRAGDPDIDPNTKWYIGQPNVKGVMPSFLDAYWPAREEDWGNWTQSTANNSALARCTVKGFWFSGFCIGQGQPPPGAYRNYSQMVSTSQSQNAPVSEIPWSLGNTYFNIITNSISLDDRDAAIQSVIGELQKGLPVLLAFPHAATAISDGNGGKFDLSDDVVTWYIPPELGGCDANIMNLAFAPNGGHDVNIIGYSVSETLANPDPFNSYFILENNWGKTAGYKSFFYMNFAAFKYLATGLNTYRLDAECPSEACQKHPRIVLPPGALARFQFPPDPEGPVSQIYRGLINEFIPYLGGQPTLTGVTPAGPEAP